MADCFPLGPYPVVELADTRGKKRLVYSHSATEFKPWMLFQSLVILRGVSVIRNIDTQANRICGELFKKLQALDPASPLQMSETTVVNKDHPLSICLTTLFPGHPEALLLPDLFSTSKELVKLVLEKIHGNISWDIKRMIDSYMAFCQTENVSDESKNRFYFWCILFPFLNLTTIITRKRSQMSPDTFGIYLMCFLLLRESALTEGSMFVSISAADQEKLEVMNQLFLTIIQLMELKEERNLGDKVLNMDSTLDEDRSQSLLVQSVNAHIEPIYEELLREPEKNQTLLTRLTPFVQVGFCKIFH